VNGAGKLELPPQSQSDEDLKPANPGDAAACSAAIEAWLRRREVGARDWQNVLAQIRNALQTLCATSVVRADERAQDILRRMVSAENMEDLAADVDLLGARIADLTGFGLGAGWRPPLATADRHSKPRPESAVDLDPPSARMVLRL
jgi:hypothetical protein